MKKVLLLLMAIIVGTGFLSAQDPLYTVLFGKEYNKDNTIQDYLSTWEVTVSNDNNKTLTITNFNNNKGGLVIYQMWPQKRRLSCNNYHDGSCQ